WKVAKSRAADGEDEKRMQGRSLGSLITWTVVTAAAILAAGFVLTKTGDALAHQSGLGASFFAVVFLAIATSLPEISTVLSAIRLRRYDLAISDVLGTNLFNVTIIVLVDFLSPGAPVLTQVGRTASVGALLALVLTAIFLVGVLERRDRTVLRMGYDSAAVLAAYVAGLFLLYQVR
ncbi:MAG TPA: sodium:calcium antiporter, partial [Beijerinckiaceae bacterium]|nr:sodium:calcium antiporter [Beijerinckiaceae bacterium]